MSLFSNTDTQQSKPKFLRLGQLRGITLTTPGSGYTNGGSVALSISAPPAGGVQATGTCSIVGGVVTSVTITNAGAGYLTVPVITVTSGAGTGAVFTPTIRGAQTDIPSFANANSMVMFVDETEATNASNRAKGIKIPGWIKYFEYVDAQAVPRYRVDTLVAMDITAGAAGDAADDTVLGDVAFSITTQPSNSTVTAPAAASFTVVSAGASGFQWQLRPAAGGQYANITNGGVYTTATTATLNISNSTGLTGNRYRCIVLNAGGNASATSTGALLTVN